MNEDRFSHTTGGWNGGHSQISFFSFQNFHKVNHDFRAAGTVGMPVGQGAAPAVQPICHIFMLFPEVSADYSKGFIILKSIQITVKKGLCL